MRMFPPLVVLTAFFAASLLSGCGPVISSYLILSAQSEIDGAEAAEAEKYAPYHYTAAKEYIQKAREEQGYAEFQPAIEFAYKAKEHAEQGRAQAEEMKKNNIPPPTPKTPLIDTETETPPATPPVTDSPGTTGNPDGPNIIIKKKPEGATPGDDAATPNVTVTPKSDAPAPETPKSDPKTPAAPESAPPKAAAPKADAPNADAPKTDAPKADAPNADAPKSDAAPKDTEAEKKPRGPIIIPIQPSTNTGG